MLFSRLRMFSVVFYQEYKSISVCVRFWGYADKVGNVNQLGNTMVLKACLFFSRFIANLYSGLWIKYFFSVTHGMWELCFNNCSYKYSGRNISWEIGMNANNAYTSSPWNLGFAPKILDLEVIVESSTIFNECVLAWAACSMHKLFRWTTFKIASGENDTLNPFTVLQINPLFLTTTWNFLKLDSGRKVL